MFIFPQSWWWHVTYFTVASSNPHAELSVCPGWYVLVYLCCLCLSHSHLTPLSSTVEPALQSLLNHPLVAQFVGSTTQYQDNSSTHGANRPLSQHAAIHYNPSPKCASIMAKFNVEGILIKLDVMYLELGFLWYKGNLQGLNIHYLEAAYMLKTNFYELDQVRMTEAASELFSQYVYMEYTKALLDHEWAKMRERAHHIASDISVGQHSLP